MTMPKNKMGRPRVLTDEQRIENKREAHLTYKEANREHLKKYQREYQAKRRARIKAEKKGTNDE